jgi:HSP20 family protein
MIQTDPFRSFDTLLGRLSGLPAGSSAFTTASMPMAMDAYRRGNEIWVHLDVPGVGPESIDISVERGVLTVTAERSVARDEGDRFYLNERGTGTFRRQVRLGEGLDTDAIEADVHDGVVTLRIPVAEKAQPKKIAVTSSKPKALKDGETAKDATITVS